MTILLFLRELISTAAELIIVLQRAENFLWFLGEFRLCIALGPALRWARVQRLPRCVASPLVILCEPMKINAAWRVRTLLKTSCLIMG